CDLAAVVGGEAAGWSAGDRVEQDAEGEREQSLGDADGEPGGGFGEVLLEPHLAFEVREGALDRQSGGGELPLADSVGGGALARRSEQRDLVGLEAGRIRTAPKAFVANDHAAWLERAAQIAQRLVLELVRADERVAKRQPATVAEHDQAHTPDPTTLRRAAAVAGQTGKLAPLRAARVVGDAEQRPVCKPNTAGVEPAGEPLLHQADQLDKRTQPAVVLRLLGQMRKPTRQPIPDQAEELAGGADPQRRLTNRERDQLRIRDLRRPRRPQRDRVLIGEHIRCNNEGFQIGRHLEPPSRGDTSGSPSSSTTSGTLRRNPPFHIKPLGPERADGGDARRGDDDADDPDPAGPLLEEVRGADCRERRELRGEDGGDRDPMARADGVGEEPADLREPG